MEYITLVKQFYNSAEVNNLATGQIALWHALAWINNKCYWSEYFSVPNRTLQLYTGLSQPGIIKARNALKQAGLIDFSVGKKGQSPIYTIKKTHESITKSITIGELSANYQDNYRRTISTTLIDKDKDKDKDIITPIIPFDGELGTSVSEWLRYKTERGQAYKPTGLNALYKKIQDAVDKNGEAAVIAAITTSISNNWNGLFFENKKSKTNDVDYGDYNYSALEALQRN